MGKAESKTVANGNINRISSYKTFAITSKFQWKISPKVTMDLNLGFGNTGKFNVSDADGTILKYDNTSRIAIGGTINISLADKLYLVTGLTGVDHGDRNVTDEVGAVIVDTDRTIGVFNIGLLTQL